jgi:hypothetical protein
MRHTLLMAEVITAQLLVDTDLLALITSYKFLGGALIYFRSLNILSRQHTRYLSSVACVLSSLKGSDSLEAVRL